MRKFLVAIVASLGIGAAAAANLPFQGEFSILSGGVVIGSGELEEGKLEINLPEGTTSFDGTITVTGEDGVVVTYEVTVGADGSILLWDTLTDLTAAVTSSGGEVEVEYETVDVEDDAAETEDGEGGEAGVADEGKTEDDGLRGLDRARERAAAPALDSIGRGADKGDRDDEGEDVAEAEEEAAERAAEDAEEAAERAAEEAEEAAERAAEAAEKAAERGGKGKADADTDEDEDEDEDEVEVEEEEDEEEDEE